MLFRIQILLLFVSLPIIIYGQDYVKNEEHYNWFDQQIGTRNLSIYNGTSYVEKYRTINENHKFFNSFKFLPGFLVYENQPYYDLELKYDIYEDILLLKSKTGAGTTLRLNSSKIKSFKIDSHEFINVNLIRNNRIDKEISGFYEVILQSPYFSLLKKNKKSLLQKIGDELVYYEFKSDNENYLFYREEYFPIRKKRDLIKIFPKFKKNINSYYTTAGNNSDSDTFLKSLLKNIEIELNKSTGPIK